MARSVTCPGCPQRAQYAGKIDNSRQQRLRLPCRRSRQVEIDAREVTVDNDVIEDDGKPDPRFTATPDQLKAKGIEDFQLHYALQTISRLGRNAAVTPAGGGARPSGKR